MPFLTVSFYFFLFLVFFVLTLLFLPISFRIEGDSLRENKHIYLYLQVTVLNRFRVWRLQKTVTPAQREGLFGKNLFLPLFEKMSKKELRPRQSITSEKDSIQGMAHIIWDFLRSVYWRQLKLHIYVGMADAAKTALLTGLLHATSACLGSYLGRRWSMAQGRPEFYVYPSYLHNKVDFSLQVVFSCNLFKIVITVLKLLMLLIGKGRQRTVPLSPFSRE